MRPRFDRSGALFLGQAQRGLHETAQHRDVDRLGDEIECAGLERGDGRVDVAVRGDHRDRRLRVLRGDQFDDFLTDAIGQFHVGEAERVTRLGETLPSPR